MSGALVSCSWEQKMKKEGTKLAQLLVAKICSNAIALKTSESGTDQ